MSASDLTPQKIVPSLWLDHTAADAASFYTSLFPGGRILATSHYPTENPPDFQQEFAGAVLTVDFELAGFRFTALNGGREFSASPANSFFVNFDPSRDPAAREHLDELWAALLDGGEVLMPLDTYPFSRRYGWVKDRFGLGWQLILTDPDPEPRPMIVPSLLFGNVAQNRAREALEYYARVLPASRLGTLFPYEEVTGPATPGALMYGEANLAGVWFAAMDAGTEMPTTFTPGVSYQIFCADQAEIDRYWDDLSAEPEAEACGWCQDRFGVSWQVVPAAMDDLMTRPGAWETLLGMKKLVIADF